MVLDTIVRSKRAEIAAAKRERPPSFLLGRWAPSEHDFEGALRRPPTGFVLECKRRSPSEGTLRERYDPAAVACALAPFADAISVVTDGPFFGGSLDDLSKVRQVVAAPILRKDFVLEPYQVIESRAFGADAVLLMLALLDDAAWKACAAAARECRMGTLTEVHTASELARALSLEAPVIGINTRDLRTLGVDLSVFDRLASGVPADRLLVAESGIRSHDDVAARRDRADAFLVGTSLMRQRNLETAVRGLVFGVVKVCGLTRPEDALAAWHAGATWGGLVFADGSPRRLSLEEARRILEAAPLRYAGVFVDESPERIGAFARELRLDAVQLHGEEGPDVVAAVRAHVPGRCEIWKAVRVRESAPRLAETGADRLLLDAWCEDRRGGTGTCFDWRIVADHPDRRRIVLAGGLRPENAAVAESVGAGILDVSSGVEESPGIKSEARLAAFFAALRGRSRGRP